MTENEYIWMKHSNLEREELLSLLRRGQKIAAIRHVRNCSGVGLREAKYFVESAWLLEKVIESDPTRMSPKDEFKAKVLRIVTDMMETISNPELMRDMKYSTLSEIDVPRLFDLCMEE